MKTLATIAPSLIAIAASLFLVLSSMFAFGGGISGTNSERGSYLICAVIALAVAMAAMSAIAKLNRKRE